MNTIWKYSLKLIPMQTIELPWGAELLSVHDQQDTICLWARVDSDKIKQPVTIEIVGTGHAAPKQNEARYLGSVLQDGGNYVWHVFVRRI
jgi:hypothetical protein